MGNLSLYEIIKAAKAAKGSNAKKAILQANADHPLLAQYLKAVYDPSISYYQTKMPKVQTGKDGFSKGVLSNLEYLSGRTYTGKAAILVLQQMLSELDAEGQELLGYIIKRKVGDGVGESMVLEVFPNLFFVPPYMRCGSMDDKALAYYASLPYFYVQTKMDGAFAYLRKDSDGFATLFTRTGNYYPTSLAEKLSKGLPAGSVVMGEMLVVKQRIHDEVQYYDRQTGNGMLNSILQADEHAVAPEHIEVTMVAWDMVTTEEFDIGLSTRTYTERLNNLDDITEYRTPNISFVQHHNVTSVAEAVKLNTEAIARGEEGTVWKDPNGPWRDSSSGTIYAVKAKVKFQAEYIITGTYEGKDKNEGKLGGITYATPCGKITGNCGVIKGDESQRDTLWAIRESLPGGIVTIEANDIVTAEGRDTLCLFLPVLIEIRNDRTEADSYERVIEQFEAAKRGGKLNKEGK